MNELTTLKKICEEFKFEGVLTECSPYGEGHINDTFLTVCEDKYEEKRRYILQRVNHLIFKETEQLMSNIENITFYLSDMVREAEIEEGFEVLKLIKTKNDNSFYKDAEGNYWRSYAFIENATGHTFAKDNDMLYSAGKAFGQFQLMLKDYPVDSLYETIKGFHHTENRYKIFLEVLEKDVHSRSKYCLDDIRFVKDHKTITTMILEALEQGEIPYRVTHNDTKLNNVLIDNESGIGRCVIDLDTVMPGSALYDFGDAIRSCGSTVAEDEENLELLKFDIDRFDAYSKGFLEVLNHELTKKEIELLPYSAIIMTLECGMRFLTDFLDGDNYFKVHKENHNLIRAKNQFRFIKEMENNLEVMKDIINRYC